jgi:hypothetical protein
MRLNFLELPAEERRLYIEQASVRRSVSPVILEKDFWVCWLLGILFGSEFADALVFKGGTSLSKVFGVIERFSEDIDLSLSPEFLKLPEAGTSRTQANKWMTKAEAACGVAVEKQIAPALEAAVTAALGKREGGWFEFLTDPATHSPVLLFRYPSMQPAGFEYLKRSVKLEFGSLTDQQPVGRHPVRPWVAEVLPAAFPDWRCEVVALEVERGASGRKRRSSTPSITAQPTSRHPTGSPVTTQTQQRSRGTPLRGERSKGTTFGIASWRGRVSSSAVRGPTMTLPSRGRSGLCRHPCGFRLCGATTTRCGTCT